MLKKPSKSVKARNGRPPSIVPRHLYTNHGNDLHEPVGNSSRKTSIQEGLYISITRQYHRWLHDTEEGELENYRLKCLMQRIWIENKLSEGYTLEQARNEWYSKFYKYYEE